MRYRFYVPRDDHTYEMTNMSAPDAIAEARTEAGWRGTAVHVTNTWPSYDPITFVAGPSGLVTSHRESDRVPA